LVRTRAIVISLLICSAIAVAQEDPRDLLGKFAQRCGATSFREDRPDMIVTDGDYTGQWRVTTMKELGDCERCHDLAVIWRTKAATLVEFEQKTESDDWQEMTAYCYDANGRATNALLRFNSAQGWAYIGYFAARDGRFVLTTKSFRKLETWAAVPEPEDWADYRDAHASPTPYVTIGRLPFASLLKKPNGSSGAV
jgi:hypothetical protein